MEYLPRGDLSRYLENRLPEAEASLVILQVLEGLDFMHRNKFAHRDLKPNVSSVRGEILEEWLKQSRS